MYTNEHDIARLDNVKRDTIKFVEHIPDSEVEMGSFNLGFQLISRLYFNDLILNFIEMDFFLNLFLIYISKCLHKKSHVYS